MLLNHQESQPYGYQAFALDFKQWVHSKPLKYDALLETFFWAEDYTIPWFNENGYNFF